MARRLYAAGNMLWGGHAIRLRVEMEVAVPLGFAMRWLASLTARGGVYYPYSDTVAVRLRLNSQAFVLYEFASLSSPPHLCRSKSL